MYEKDSYARFLNYNQNCRIILYAIQQVILTALKFDKLTVLVSHDLIGTVDVRKISLCRRMK